MIYDGLTNVYDGKHMGICAEKCAKEYQLTRLAQDEYAITSFQRAKQANQQQIFKEEIVPVHIKLNNGQTKIIDQDEGFNQFDENKLKQLKPSFVQDKNGTVTAGNASQLSDGAACIIIVSGKLLNDKKYSYLKPLAKIISYADAAQEPVNFTTTLSNAFGIAIDSVVVKALKKNGNLNLNDLNEKDYFEINEAFAAVSLANQQILKLSSSNINIYGGAIALGHPLGCSGARIVVTLLNVLKHKQGRYGIASLCNGGGGAGAMIIENLQHQNKYVQSKL